MKTPFQLATGPLSYLKEVTIDLELKGKHFDELLVADENTYERAVLSVLKDLMDEDPFQLTLREVYHLFTMVKISSLGTKLSLNVKCRHVLHDQTPTGASQRECGALNPVEYSLVDSDVERAPADFKAPEITFNYGGSEQVYEVRPPTMAQELDLLSYFQERGISKDELVNNKLMALEYSKHRILIHLVNKETGNRFFDRKQREDAVKAIADNSLRFMKDAGDAMELVNSFGISTKRMNIVCKECGGKISYRLPLPSGLSM